MNLIDVIALAKAGYTKRDIEKIRAEEKEAEETELPFTDETIEDEVSLEESSDEEMSEVVDYKALYEESIKTIQAKDETISVLQKANAHKDLGDDKSSDIRTLAEESLKALLD